MKTVILSLRNEYICSPWFASFESFSWNRHRYEHELQRCLGCTLVLPVRSPRHTRKRPHSSTVTLKGFPAFLSTRLPSSAVPPGGREAALPGLPPRRQVSASLPAAGCRSRTFLLVLVQLLGPDDTLHDPCSSTRLWCEAERGASPPAPAPGSKVVVARPSLTWPCRKSCPGLATCCGAAWAQAWCLSLCST